MACVCIAPGAIIDHLAILQPGQLQELLPANEQQGGSQRIKSVEDAQRLLTTLPSFTTRAAGSVANVARNLSALGIATRLVSTCGRDEWGQLFVNSMQRVHVDIKHVMSRHGHTGRSIVMCVGGQRTMRTFLDQSIELRASDLDLNMFQFDPPASTNDQTMPNSSPTASMSQPKHSKGSTHGTREAAGLTSMAISHQSSTDAEETPSTSGRIPVPMQGGMPPNVSSGGMLPHAASARFDMGQRWCFLSAYALHSGPALLEKATDLARMAGARVALDLASFEVVREHRPQLMQLIEAARFDVIICNEDEAAALVEQETRSGPGGRAAQTAAVEYMARYTYACVVTLGADGCMAAGGARASADEWPGPVKERHIEPSQRVEVIDSTGAGDAFCAGFLYGAMRGLPLSRCARLGCAAGASAVRVVGSELAPSDWQYFHHSVRGRAASSLVEGAASEVHVELLEATALVERLGRGVVYFGSARLGEGSAYYERVVEFAREVSLLLRATCWTGGGPGMMRAASEGALAAGCVAVGGIKISREAGQDSVLVDDYLAPGTSLVCKHMPSRKAALMDAGLRLAPSHRTAYIFLPGGLGTLDELFALLTLVQLNKLGSKYEVPLVILNLDGFYDGLLSLLSQFEADGVLSRRELATCMVARSCEEAVSYLLEFYRLVPSPASPAACSSEPVLVLGDERSTHHNGASNIKHAQSLSSILAASSATPSAPDSKAGSKTGSVHAGMESLTLGAEPSSSNSCRH